MARKHAVHDFTPLSEAAEAQLDGFGRIHARHPRRCERCYLCVRYESSPMSQVAQSAGSACSVVAPARGDLPFTRCTSCFSLTCSFINPLGHRHEAISLHPSSRPAAGGWETVLVRIAATGSPRCPGAQTA